MGDGLEAMLRAHHRRRLRKSGWAAVLNPPPSGDWWAARAPVRPGNEVEVLIDGASALHEMEQAIAGAQHSVYIANWHASPSFRLSRGDDAIALRDLLAEVAERVPVRLLLWAGPPLPVFEPTRTMVRLARREFVKDSRVRCELDKRERTMHCHHEKIVIVDDAIAFVGGLDFTAVQGDRFDDPAHEPRKALRWHDAAVRMRGPAVADVARHFVERWTAVSGEELPSPREHEAVGNVDVQVVRTITEKTYDFAPRGVFTILDTYLRALTAARSFIYLENQFLWSPEIVDVLEAKLRNPPSDDFRALLVLPTRPSSGRDTTRGQLSRLIAADSGHNRLLATTVVGRPAEDFPPVYVHAKIGIVDDHWLTVGSANLNEHSLFNDSEVNLVMCDDNLATATRLRLWSEHTERPVADLTSAPQLVIDTIWRPIAEEQAKRQRDGLELTHRLTLLPNVSRRTDRLEGPIRGLLVDG